MAFLRTTTSRGHRYRQRVEWCRDPETRRRHLRILENLGPERPIYHRTPVPQSFSLDPPLFGLLAMMILRQEVSPHQLIDLLRQVLPRPPPLERLQALGIRYDVGEETIQLLLWSRSPSALSLPARTTRRKRSSRCGPRPCT